MYTGQPFSRRLTALLPCAFLAAASLLLSGCSTDFSQNAATLTQQGLIHGAVIGGQQPVSLARVYMYAASTSGYGTPSRSLLGGPGYVTTDANGMFSISGDYSCLSTDQVYLLAVGGNPGLANPAAINPAIALMAPLGTCNQLSPSDVINVNEATTVAAAYALSGYMTSPTALSSSGTTAAQLGVSNAFLTALNLISLPGGGFYTTTPAGNGIVPQAELNTLADILSACVNSDGSGTPCSQLFGYATPPGGTPPADTAQAVLNIAHNPGINVAQLFFLSPSSPPFQPALSVPPTDWTVGVSYSGGGIHTAGTLQVDGNGHIWVVNNNNGTPPAVDSDIAELDNLGNPISPSTGYTDGTLAGTTGAGVTGGGIAIDTANHVWMAAVDGGPNGTLINARLGVLISGGTWLTSASGYSGGGLSGFGSSLTFDPSGNVWASSYNLTYNVDGSGNVTYATNPAMSKFDASGNALSPAGGYTGAGQTFSLVNASDVSGNIWAPNGYLSDAQTPADSVAEFANSGARVSPSTGWTNSSINSPSDVTIDHSGNIWVPDSGSNSLSELTPVGSNVTVQTYTGFPATSNAVAVDGLGRIIVAGLGPCTGSITASDTLSVFDPSTSTIVSPSAGYQSAALNCPVFVAVDASGNLWVANTGSYDANGLANGYTVAEMVGFAAPVVVPRAVAVATNQLGARP